MFSVIPNPTFEAEVLIPIPGGDPAGIQFVFKHKNKDELNEFSEELKRIGKIKANTPQEKIELDCETLLLILDGWKSVKEKFSEDSLKALLNNYSKEVPNLILDKYFDEMLKAPIKN